jgi:predicted transcriptional regulator
LSFVLEDPVLRLDFSHALKELGHYTDGSFNSELVRVKGYALLAFILKYGKADERMYKAVAERAGEHEKDLRAYMKKNMTPLEWAKKAFEYVKENPLEFMGFILGIVLPKK